MIRYQNIYHMLAYAFRVLNAQGYKDVATEDFENTADLLAAILCHGVKVQLKRGLLHEYIATTETTTMPRGKIDITASLKSQAFQRKQLVCHYDTFTANAYNNRIIKTTFLVLLKNNISKERKKEIKKLLIYFSDIEILKPNTINWKQQYNKNNQTYQMLIVICHMVLKGLLQTTIDGTVKLMNWLDDQHMHKLYEKFVLEYFRYHYAPNIKAKSSEIKWILDNKDDRTGLPLMLSDVMLTCGKKILIIDTKYYGHIKQTQYDKATYRSANLYQIFTYVKNMEAALSEDGYTISGMLLYAQTDEEDKYDSTYLMSGNKVSIKTLDLNCAFSEIRAQLDNIANTLMYS